MLDRCYLTASLPIQLIWGDRDTVIPVSHAHTAHTSMPGSRLDTFPDAGHFPFRDDPLRFVHTIEKFLSETRPSPFDEARWRQLLNTGTVQPTLTPDASTRATALDTIGPPERKAT